MAIVTKTVGFTIEVDEDAIAPASVYVFIYQMVNRLNYEHTITSVTVDDVTVDTSAPNALYDLPLGEDRPLEAGQLEITRSAISIK